MDRALHDPRDGYYASGRAALGRSGHFDTWPERLGPDLGAMVAETARQTFEAIQAAGRLPPDAPLTILELGAGQGTLARAVADHLEACADEARWRPWAGRVRVVVGDRGPALRARQAEALGPHLAAGRAQVRAIDAQALAWEGPFFGLVVANELLDAFAIERFRRDAPAAPVCRVHMAPDGDGVREVDVPLALGWWTEGAPGPLPADAAAHLAASRPLLDDLAALGLLPAEVPWCPGLRPFVDGVAALIDGPDRAGRAVVVDYGGTARYTADPCTAEAHVRAYGADRRAGHAARSWHAPGAFDITWDVDFTAVGRAARAAGLGAVWFGHQGALRAAVPRGWRWRDPARCERFAHAAGFRMMVVAPSWLAGLDLGPPDPWDGPGLATLHPGVTLDGVVPAPLHEVLHPGGDPVADLLDAGLYDHRAGVVRALVDAGALVAPGEVPWQAAGRLRAVDRAALPSSLAAAFAVPASVDEVEWALRPELDGEGWASVEAALARAWDAGGLVEA